MTNQNTNLFDDFNSSEEQLEDEINEIIDDNNYTTDVADLLPADESVELENGGLPDDSNEGAEEEDEDFDQDSDDIAEESLEEEEEDLEQTVAISRSKLEMIVKLLDNIRDNQERLNQLLSPYLRSNDYERIKIGQLSDENFDNQFEEIPAKIIEGVFDGENMIGPDGKKYSMPANYASKSKLVEGDIMKLTISDNGTFVYKQISPVERIRVVGVLERVSEGNHLVAAGNGRWRVLNASVTYYRGKPGDEVIILVPKAGGSTWAAVDNIVKKQ